MNPIPQVLFVCVHNAGRSQMAAAFLHHHAEGTVEVRSAGSAPADPTASNSRTPWLVRSTGERVVRARGAAVWPVA